MKEGNDSVEFINYPEAALKRSKIPENEWPGQAQSRITLAVGQTLGQVIGHEHTTFQDIKYAITGVSRKSFAAAAEGIFVPYKDRKVPTARALAYKLLGLLKKVTQEATNEADVLEKLMVACVRSTLNKDLKNYIDQTDVSTLQKYPIKINEWKECRSEGKSINSHIVG